MGPGIACVPSLFCAEEVSGSGWDDESSSYGEVDLVDDLYNGVLQGFPVLQGLLEWCSHSDWIVASTQTGLGILCILMLCRDRA